MCLPSNASMEEVYKAEVECLRNQLAEKDATIKHLEDLLDNALAEVESLRNKLSEKDKEIEELRYLLDQANGMLPKEFRLKEKEDD